MSTFTILREKPGPIELNNDGTAQPRIRRFGSNAVLDETPALETTPKVESIKPVSDRPASLLGDTVEEPASGAGHKPILKRVIETCRRRLEPTESKSETSPRPLASRASPKNLSKIHGVPKPRIRRHGSNVVAESEQTPVHPDNDEVTGAMDERTSPSWERAHAAWKKARKQRASAKLKRRIQSVEPLTQEELDPMLRAMHLAFNKDRAGRRAAESGVPPPSTKGVILPGSSGEETGKLDRWSNKVAWLATAGLVGFAAVSLFLAGPQENEPAYEVAELESPGPGATPLEMDAYGTSVGFEPPAEAETDLTTSTASPTVEEEPTTSATEASTTTTEEEETTPQETTTEPTTTNPPEETAPETKPTTPDSPPETPAPPGETVADSAPPTVPPTEPEPLPTPTPVETVPETQPPSDGAEPSVPTETQPTATVTITSAPPDLPPLDPVEITVPGDNNG